jgi:hypothetical protein
LLSKCKTLSSNFSRGREGGVKERRRQGEREEGRKKEGRKEGHL